MPAFNDKTMPHQFSRHVTEGCCPMGHGPLMRTARYEAVCIANPCDFQYFSTRVDRIFPHWPHHFEGMEFA